MKADIEKSILRWKLLPGSVPSQNLSAKTTTPKQKRKLPVKPQISVKSTTKRTQKTSLSITSALASPLFKYEEPITKDAETQADNYWSMMVYWFITVKIILESKIQEYSTQIQELQKELCS